MSRQLIFVPVAFALMACSIDQPTAVTKGPRADATAAFSAVKFWDAGATVRWNAIATDLAAVRVTDVNRFYAYLSLAQLRAAEAAKEAPGPHPPISAAIGGASVAVLRAFFPLDVATIEAALDAQRAAPAWPGAKHADFDAGEIIGRAVGARVVAFAAGDRFGLTDPLLPPIGPPPVGPGRWVYNGGAIARSGLGARPFYLTSHDQLRPPPPPAFGSPAFNTALAEVHQISVTRTAEQTAIANFWNVNQSPRSNAAVLAVARELIVSHRRSDAEAAKIMFLMTSATFDAIIACFNAKYHYWFIRPPQANTGIVTVFPTPPHPSYPAAHSCASGAMSAVLADAFPSERQRLDAMAIEAGLSRIYAGIHYRFDIDAGLALGRAAAALALQANLDQVAPLP